MKINSSEIKIDLNKNVSISFKGNLLGIFDPVKWTIRTAVTIVKAMKTVIIPFAITILWVFQQEYSLEKKVLFIIWWSKRRKKKRFTKLLDTLECSSLVYYRFQLYSNASSIGNIFKKSTTNVEDLTWIENRFLLRMNLMEKLLISVVNERYSFINRFDFH